MISTWELRGWLKFLHQNVEEAQIHYYFGTIKSNLFYLLKNNKINNITTFHSIFNKIEKLVKIFIYINYAYMITCNFILLNII